MTTQDRVRELFDYRDDGTLIWRLSQGTAKAGDIAGSVFGRRGCINIKIDGRRYFAHRLVFLYHHGWLPKTLDHANRNQRDNRVENLRPADDVQNAQNASLRRDNTSGWKGVSWNKVNRKWIASIKTMNRTTYLGSFCSSVEAAAAYNQAAAEHFGEFAVLNDIPKK